MSGRCLPVVITGEHKELKLAGDRLDFLIEGHHLAVTISGRSNRIRVSGHHNDIFIEQPQVIEASGHDNNIVYGKGTPEVTQAGVLNQIASIKGKVPVPGDGQATEDDARVSIVGSGMKLIRQGQVRSFSISGSGRRPGGSHLRERGRQHCNLRVGQTPG